MHNVLEGGHGLGGLIGGPNLSLTRAERGAFLAKGQPGQKTTAVENDGPTHRSKLEKQKVGPFPDGIAQLQTPTCIAVRAEVVRVRNRGEHVVISLRVGRQRKVQRGVCDNTCHMLLHSWQSISFQSRKHLF